MFENRIRRMAERRGYRLQKCRRRDSRAIGYGGYMLIEVDRNLVVCGANPHEYAATLADVEAYLESE